MRLSSILIPPVPCSKTLATIVFSDKGFLAKIQCSLAGFNALPQPCHCFASSVIPSGAETIETSQALKVEPSLPVGFPSARSSRNGFSFFTFLSYQ